MTLGLEQGFLGSNFMKDALENHIGPFLRNIFPLSGIWLPLIDFGSHSRSRDLRCDLKGKQGPYIGK